MIKIITCIVLLCSICDSLFSADIISYHYPHELQERADEYIFEMRVQMDVIVIDDSHIEITVMKYITNLSPMLNFTTVAKYESGRYVFSGFMDFLENDVFGYVIFDKENETAILFVDAVNPMGGLGNIGRLYGETHVMTKGTLPGGDILPKVESMFDMDFRPLAFAEARFSVEGVWDFVNPSMLHAVERNLSWGRRIVPESGFIVDLHSDPPMLEVFSIINSESDLYPIISINEEGNRTEMTVSADWRQDNITVFFTFNEDGTVWIERELGARWFSWSPGRHWVYRKYDGPEFDQEAEKAERASAFQITHVTTEDLPLLEMADTESKVLAQLSRGSGVQLIWQTNIYHPKSQGNIFWSRLVLPDGTAGWVFTDTGLQEAVADTAGSVPAKSAAWLFLLLPVPLAAAGFFLQKS